MSSNELQRASQTSPEAILHFWFGNPQDPAGEYDHQRRCWFQKDPDFDREIRQRFSAIFAAAAAGQLHPWQAQPQRCLALVLLLDQFSRNLFRGEPRSFATDPQALAVTEYALAHRYDQQLRPVERLFLYLPLEHSENLDHQLRSVVLFEALARSAPELNSTLDYAYRHRDVIAQFGRFPHRNDILGRESTPAEIEFLKQPGSRF
jgi:uncharacterized protein (DUF924 family)